MIYDFSKSKIFLLFTSFFVFVRTIFILRPAQMITNPDWLKLKVKPYFHQISLECIEEIAEYIEDNDIEEIDCDSCLIMQEILSDEIDEMEFLEFAIENISELFSYIVTGRVNIRIWI